MIQELSGPSRHGEPAAARRIGQVLVLGAGLVAACAGCGPSGAKRAAAPAGEVVVYTAQDPEFADPIFSRFRRQSGIEVLTKGDTESTKTVGLANAIIAEARRPRADVFWNNEVLNTLRLQRRGLLEPCDPPNGRDYPAQTKAADGSWFGFAARARVLLVNRRRVKPGEVPTSIFDLTGPRWRNRVGIAKPLFGTTATQVACLFAVLGEDRARDFYRGLKRNGVRVLAGNQQVAASVGTGDLDVGLTDTDDAHGEQLRGSPVQIVFPDAGPGQIGTLFIPNTVAMIRGAPHRAAAEQMVNDLLSPAVETALAEGPSVQIPLNPKVHVKPAGLPPGPWHPMVVDFTKAAALWDPAAAFIRDEFTAP